jgi:hypothetical protein
MGIGLAVQNESPSATGSRDPKLLRAPREDGERLPRKVPEALFRFKPLEAIFAGREVFEVALTGIQENFSITLADKTYRFMIRGQDALPDHNARHLDNADRDGKPIISGLPLLAGHDLLGQHAYLEFRGRLAAQTDGSEPTANPTLSNLGTGSHLYFSPGSRPKR